MKNLIFLIAMLLVAPSAEAQLFKKKDRNVGQQYDKGEVQVKNGKVTFEKVIPAEGLTAAQVQETVNNWISERYVEPTVISVKRFNSEQPGVIVIKGEEYIVFKNTFLVLSRARIYYYLTLTAKDGSCQFNMSRITYWYDDEDEKGGIRMKAEDWITDEMAFSEKGGLKNFEGKFRTKTIDLKEQLVEELKNKLNKIQK